VLQHTIAVRTQLNLQENPGTYTTLHMRTIHQLLSVT